MLSRFQLVTPPSLCRGTLIDGAAVSVPFAKVRVLYHAAPRPGPTARAHLVAEGDPPVRMCAVSLRAPHLAEHHWAKNSSGSQQSLGREVP